MIVTKAKGRAAEWAVRRLARRRRWWLAGCGGGYPGGGGRGGPRRPTPSRGAAHDGKKILERISKETGGRFFEVTKKETVGDIYTSIAEELRTQYSMAIHR